MAACTEIHLISSRPLPFTCGLLQPLHIYFCYSIVFFHLIVTRLMVVLFLKLIVEIEIEIPTQFEGAVSSPVFLVKLVTKACLR